MVEKCAIIKYYGMPGTTLDIILSPHNFKLRYKKPKQMHFKHNMSI